MAQQNFAMLRPVTAESVALMDGMLAALAETAARREQTEEEDVARKLTELQGRQAMALLLQVGSTNKTCRGISHAQMRRGYTPPH